MKNNFKIKSIIAGAIIMFFSTSPIVAFAFNEGPFDESSNSFSVDVTNMPSVQLTLLDESVLFGEVSPIKEDWFKSMRILVKSNIEYQISVNAIYPFLYDYDNEESSNDQNDKYIDEELPIESLSLKIDDSLEYVPLSLENNLIVDKNNNKYVGNTYKYDKTHNELYKAGSKFHRPATEKEIAFVKDLATINVIYNKKTDELKIIDSNMKDCDGELYTSIPIEYIKSKKQNPTDGKSHNLNFKFQNNWMFKPLKYTSVVKVSITPDGINPPKWIYALPE